MLIVGARANSFIQTGYCLEIVIKDVWQVCTQKIERFSATSAKIRSENFNLESRASGPQRTDTLCKMLRSAIAQIVTVHRGYYHVT